MAVQTTTTGGAGSVPPVGYPGLDEIDGIMVRLMPAKTEILTRWFVNRYLVSVRRGGTFREWSQSGPPDYSAGEVLASASKWASESAAIIRNAMSIPVRGGRR